MSTFEFRGAFSVDAYPELQSNPELADKVKDQVTVCAQMAVNRKPKAAVYKSKVQWGGVEYTVVFRPQ